MIADKKRNKKKCIDCGVEFKPKSGNQKRCGVDCKSSPTWLPESNEGEKWSWFKDGAVPLRFQARNCFYCGNEYIANHGNQKHCGDDCSSLPSWYSFASDSERKEFRSRGKSPLRFIVKKCETCLAPFIGKSSKQKCCDKQCQKDLTKQKIEDTVKHDPVTRISKYSRTLIRNTLKKQYTSKHRKSFDLIGMTGKEFMEYLLSHDSCQADFTADNYGSVWHVDHIRPLASFNLADESQQKEAFHYSNCQPLSVEDNLKKSSFYEGERHHHVGRN